MKYLGKLKDPKDLVTKEYVDYNIKNGTTANAEQLITDQVIATDNTPYLFRRSANGAEIGNREKDTIVGGTVAWNQRVQNGNFADDSRWSVNRMTLAVANNKATLTAPSNVGSSSSLYTTVGVVSGHKYLVSVYVTPNAATSMRLRLGGSYITPTTAISANTRTLLYGIAASTASDSILYLYVNQGSSLVEGNTVVVENFMCFDLTAMFGTAIADRASSLENANLYDASKNTNGYYYDDDLSMVASASTTMTEYIPVDGASVLRIGGTATQNSSKVRVNFFDKDKNIFSQQVFLTPSGAFGWGATIPGNAYYVRLSFNFSIVTMSDIIPPTGMAWLKSYGFFSKPYYPYNAGELVSVKPSAHKTVGFNQWDEEWELGTLNSSGQNATSAYRIRSINYVPVMAGKNYYCKSTNPLWAVAYDANKVIISDAWDGTYYKYLQNSAFTVPSGACFIRFVVEATSYANDICINLSDPDKNGTYEPYTANSYSLDDSTEWRGLFKLDADGNLYADGDTYKTDGTVSRRFKVVDLGTLTWERIAQSGTTYLFSTSNTDVKKAQPNGGLCPAYNFVGQAEWTDLGDKEIAYRASLIRVRDDAYTDAATFKTAMNGVYLIYELATPTTETAEPFQTPQIVSADGTEQYIDDRTVAIPVGHSTEYMADLVGKLENLPSMDTADLAEINRRILASFPTDSASGAIVSIPDGADGIPVKAMTVDIEPLQDLHGYDNPWPAGGNINLYGGTFNTLFTLLTPIPANTQFTASGDNDSSQGYVETYDGDGVLINSYRMQSLNDADARRYVTITETVAVASVKFTNTQLTNSQIALGTTKTYSPYSNECPITGWTGANIVRTGKNLIDASNADLYDVDGQGLMRNATQPFTLAPGTYTISQSGTSEFTFVNITDNYAATGGIKTTSPKTVTVAQTSVCIVRSTSGTKNTNQFINNNLMVEVGSSASDYAPFNGTTYTVTWQDEAGTIYKGYLTYNGDGTWTLTKTHAVKTFDGTETWNTASNGAFYTSNITDFDYLFQSGLNAVSNKYAFAGTGASSTVVSNSPNSFGIYVGNNTALREMWINDATVSAVSAFVTALTNTPLQVLYQLVTPTTYTLTTAELITTLLGDNNLWADTGDVTVQYRADVELYIQKFISNL